LIAIARRVWLHAVFVLAALAILSACDGDDAPDERATSTPATAATREADRPDVAPLSCRTLLTQDAIDNALDVWNRPSGEMDTIRRARGEICEEAIASDSDVFVRIEPGRPDDFAPGTELRGVEGVRVADIGDAALWFEGSAPESDSAEGTLVVAQQSSVGGVVFRVTVGRPDLEPDGQLDVAKAVALSALPRFPGVTIERPTVTIEHEPIDRSGQGFVENLLAREEDGEWSRAEGIVSTLQYLAGELDAGEVLREAAVLDESSTGIIDLASEYASTDGDAATVAEVERLVQLLTVREPRRMAADLRREPAGSSVRFVTGRLPQEVTPSPDDGLCYTVYPAYGDPCFTSTDAAPEFAGKYVFWYPLLEPGQTEWEGWTFGPSTVRDAIRASAVFVESLGGGAPRVEVTLGPFQGHSSVFLDGSVCHVVLNKGAQALRDRSPDLLQQAVASTIARCYVDWNFQLPEQWEAPIAWYMSDVVYREASIETVYLEIPATLAGEELGTPLTDRVLTNMAFFEYLHANLGLQGTLEVVGTLASSGIESVPGIEEFLHDYARALSEGFIHDSADNHAYTPPERRTPLSEGLTVSGTLAEFGVQRIRVVVPSGNHACLEYPDASNLDVTASWRSGARVEAADWTDELPDVVEGEGVFVFTATAGGAFSIRVTDLDDDPECDEEDESEPAQFPSPCPDFCDPSDYFYLWDQIRQHFSGD
jgi:hypothetical protein